MTKKTGFNIRIDAFLPIDKTDFAAQAKVFQMVADIQKSGKLPDDFFDAAVILAISPKQGTADVPDAPMAEKEFDPASVPLTTDPLPDGATVLESTTALDGSIFQTIRMADQTEAYRRISAEQNLAENPEPVTEQDANGKVVKRGGKAVAE